MSDYDSFLKKFSKKFNEVFLQSRDSFDRLPSFDYWIHQYKILADLPTEKPMKHTDKQHDVAKMYGFKDWQSLHYWLKSKWELLSTISLSNEEWGYLFDAFRDNIQVYKDAGHRKLWTIIFIADRFEHLSGKWFNDQSKVDDDGENWEPSTAMCAFVPGTSGFLTRTR